MGGEGWANHLTYRHLPSAVRRERIRFNDFRLHCTHTHTINNRIIIIFLKFFFSFFSVTDKYYNPRGRPTRNQ